MKSLAGKVAVITGGGAGIGRAIAHALADSGVHVVVADIHAEAAGAVAVELAGLGKRAIAVACDVASPQSMEALAAAAYAEFGAVDILCNNAGVTWRPLRSILDTTLDEMKFIFGINYWGVVHGLMAFLPRMKQQQGEKHLVNTASIGGLLPMTGHVPYGSSKAAVAYLSETVAQELAPHGFGMTILCPGIVATDLAANTASVRGGTDTNGSRVFAPVPTPMVDRLGELGVLQPGEVGVMVRNAILDGTLYLHTAALPRDLVRERAETLFGPATTGRR
jgi:NAD(P)-dependent dehydrogenase (short-subunit alcohol dehydrogenase family)